VLFCLTLFSMHFTGGLYARYVSRGTGSDDARVAKFDVNITGDTDELEVVLDTTGTDNEYSIEIENLSEVAVEYDVSVLLESSIEASGVTATLSKTSGQLAVGGSDTCVLTVEVIDWSKITQNMSGESGSVFVSFTVVINTVQID
ncbi:MAG: hypothetical protein IKU19_05800, partial [Clostridia bacterium]|nr:hypothetical protein [Clostridia bacterium]